MVMHLYSSYSQYRLACCLDSRCVQSNNTSISLYVFTSHSASVRVAILRPSHLKTTLSFASNAGAITASVDQDSLVYDALKQLQAGQGRCWRLPEHSVMHLCQTWKPAQQQIAVCRRCMPMAFVSCTLQNLP